MTKAQQGRKAIEDAMADYRAGDYDSALLTLAAAVVDEDDYLDLAYLLGLCYIRMNKYDEALLYLEQLVTSGINDARIEQCRFALAYIYSITDRNKLAEYELKKIISDYGESARSLSGLGYSLWAQGRKEEALECYRKAVQLDPENKTALNGCGYIMACLNTELPRALRYCETAMAADPNNIAYQDSVGWVYFKLNRIEQAARFIGKAVRALPENSEIRQHVDAIRRKAKK
ncbi:MAG: tetratricopeptide repeat protein [Spirochaetes bacterium]|nr:tetratricopeptide repeat protein [Spirochaetota bacterium]MBU0956153.1 tetratricopeptide repeat protein [Spirochaetota bacterium]